MSQEEIFACEKCEKMFTTKFSLNRHQFIHSNVKKFVCKFCPKRFALKQYLKEHECIHTDDKPYVCGVNGCKQMFRQRGKLSLHRRKHKGYKMKEYTLVKKDREDDEIYSQSELMEQTSHQHDTHSINETSEIDEESKVVIPVNKDRAARKRKRTSQNSNESDSEFELPTYSTKKKMVDWQRASKRQRKTTYKLKDYLSEHSLNEFENHENLECTSSNHFDESKSEYPSSNNLNVPKIKKQCRKISSDSTNDCLSNSKKMDNNIEKHPSAFKKVSKIGSSTSNFGLLVKAFKICEDLRIMKQNCGTLHEEYEESKVSATPLSMPVSFKGAFTQNLNCAVMLLNNETFDNMHQEVLINHEH